MTSTQPGLTPKQQKAMAPLKHLFSTNTALQPVLQQVLLDEQNNRLFSETTQQLQNILDSVSGVS